MSYLLIIINFILLVYILMKIKNRKNFLMGMKIILVFGIFFSLGSISSLQYDYKDSPIDVSIESSILAIILYSIYIYRAVIKQQIVIYNM